MTEQTKTKYLKSPYHCPVCGTEDIEANGWDGEGSFQEVSCKKGHHWHDIYKLVDVEIRD